MQSSATMVGARYTGRGPGARKDKETHFGRAPWAGCDGDGEWGRGPLFLY
jgi:hypothetical protein